MNASDTEPPHSAAGPPDPPDITVVAPADDTLNATTTAAANGNNEQSSETTPPGRSVVININSAQKSTGGGRQGRKSIGTVKRRGRALTRGRITQTLGSLHDSSMEEVQVLDLDDLLEKEEEDELWERYKDLEPVYDGNPFVPDPSPEPPKAAPPFSSLPPSPGLVNFFGASADPVAPSTTWISAPTPNSNVSRRNTISHAPTPMFTQVPQFVNSYSTEPSVIPALSLEKPNANNGGGSGGDYNEKNVKASFDTVRTLHDPPAYASGYGGKLPPPPPGDMDDSEKPPRRIGTIICLVCCLLTVVLTIIAFAFLLYMKLQFSILDAKLTMSGTANVTSTADSLSLQSSLTFLLVSKQSKDTRVSISLSHGYARAKTGWIHVAAHERRMISSPVSLLYNRVDDKGWKHLKRLMAICQQTSTSDGKQGIAAAPPVVWKARMRRRIIFQRFQISFNYEVDVVTECPIPNGTSSELLSKLASDANSKSDQDPLPAATE